MDNEVVFGVIALALLILLLLAAMVIAFFVAGRQKIRQQVELAETRLAYEKELRTVETEVTETMMSQFATELHDNIGQLLTALHIQMENLKLDHAQISESLKPAETYISEINQQLRILSRTLNHDFIGHLGLLPALRLECERLRALKRFELETQIPEGDSNLQKNQELMVFRIFQEMVQNTLRHSRATHVHLRIDNTSQGFLLELKDDGAGFDLGGTLESSRASGLRNMQKRARLAELSLEIRTARGQGCLYIIKKTGNLGAE